MRFDVAKIRRARVLKGWTQRRLALLAGMDAPRVCQVERGRSNNPETVKKLADLLGLTMEDLLIDGNGRKRRTA